MEKVEETTKQRERIERLKAQDGGEGEREREHRLKSMRRRLEETKIWADINDPLVKKRFEDGDGMSPYTRLILHSKPAC